MIGKLLDWWRKRWQPAPPSDALWHDVIATLPFLAALTDEENRRLRRLTECFLAEKEFTPAGGLHLNDFICLSIAAQGCLLILNLGLEYYQGWVGIIVYPDEFVIPRCVEDEFGVVHEYEELASGESWAGGPLLISWQDVQMAGSGYNVVIHEFAHKLDMLHGEVNGMPPLPPRLSTVAWQEVLLSSYDHFCARVATTEENADDPLFDSYATENPGEFFAVMSEAFFESPALLQAEYPALFANLAAFYRQDPLARLAAARLGPSASAG